MRKLSWVSSCRDGRVRQQPRIRLPNPFDDVEPLRSIGFERVQLGANVKHFGPVFLGHVGVGDHQVAVRLKPAVNRTRSDAAAPVATLRQACLIEQRTHHHGEASLMSFLNEHAH